MAPTNDARPSGRPPIRAPEAYEYFTYDHHGPRFRFCVVGNPHTTLALGVDEDRFREDIRRIQLALLFVLPLGLLLTASGSWYFTRRALRPIGMLADLTERINAQGLHERIRVKDGDAEFQRLITVFNGMLERLERSFTQATRFSADAAHELKTPLSLIRMFGELLLLERPTPEEKRKKYLQIIVGESERLTALIANVRLVSISRSIAFTDQPCATNSLASQSSNSGWLGGRPRTPKSFGVVTKPRPK